jgi:hypothetical protein
MRTICLNRNPLCVVCEKAGVVKAAKEVDHITPHRGDEGLFSDLDNLQGLCKSAGTCKLVTRRIMAWLPIICLQCLPLISSCFLFSIFEDF